MWGQDAGYWPSSIFACLWTKTKSRPINTKKSSWPILSSWPNKLGQWMMYYIEKDDYFGSPLWLCNYVPRGTTTCVMLASELSTESFIFYHLFFRFLLPTIGLLYLQYRSFNYFGKFTSCMTFSWVVNITINHSLTHADITWFSIFKLCCQIADE